MNNPILEKLNELIKYPKETEWLEFKRNWFNPDQLGEYISALSNSAAFKGVENGYFIWGISDDNHEIVGTDFDYTIDIKNEPLEHYLARSLSPSIAFRFDVIKIKTNKIIILTVPAAKNIPVSYKNERYIRIGSSKERLLKYPQRESVLWSILRNGLPTITTVESKIQNLTFSKLLAYYGSRGLKLNEKSFERNLHLLTEDGKYNMLARILSDSNEIPVRVSIFKGESKSDPLYSVKEYGNTCILYALDKILEYGDAINVPQADESNRIIERKETLLFNFDAFREAVINAFVHNNWLDGNAPMITIYENRIEILSHGGLPNNQTYDRFFTGVSRPVNEELATIFLQLRINERLGRGVPKVVEIYGKSAYDIGQSTIVVTIPFNLIGKGKKSHNEAKQMNSTQEKIIGEILNNPNITTDQLAYKLDLSRPGINKNLRIMKLNGLIKRIGANKNGYWQVIEPINCD